MMAGATRLMVIQLTLCCAVGRIALCDDQVPAPAVAGPRQQGVGDAQTYRVGPGDLLAVSVLGVPELKQTTRVSNSGKIRLANLGILTVDGLSPYRVGELIAAELREKQLVQEAWVQVQVSQYRAHPVFVLGEVMQPGQYVITDRRMFVADLIAKAQGLSRQADPIAYLYRVRADQSADSLKVPARLDSPPGVFANSEVVAIDVVGLSRGTAPEGNIELRGGDILYVRQGEGLPRYYVIGAVNAPGIYQSQDTEPLLTHVIAGAGGLARTAKASQCLLVRSGKTGIQEHIGFDYYAMLRGERPNITLRPNDIIFVPGSGVKTIAYGFMGLIPNIAVAGASSNASARQTPK